MLKRRVQTLVMHPEMKTQHNRWVQRNESVHIHICIYIHIYQTANVCVLLYIWSIGQNISNIRLSHKASASALLFWHVVWVWKTKLDTLYTTLHQHPHSPCTPNDTEDREASQPVHARWGSWWECQHPHWQSHQSSLPRCWDDRFRKCHGLDQGKQSPLHGTSWALTWYQRHKCVLSHLSCQSLLGLVSRRCDYVWLDIPVPLDTPKYTLLAYTCLYRNYFRFFWRSSNFHPAQQLCTQKNSSNMEVAIFSASTQIYSLYESIQKKVATGKPCKRRSASKDELGSSNLTNVKHVLNIESFTYSWSPCKYSNANVMHSNAM